MTVGGQLGRRKKEGVEREQKEREREKKFAEKCEGLFWRPCRKHSFFFPLLLHFLLLSQPLPPSRRHIATPSNVVKNSGSPAECRRKFSFSTAFEGWTRGQREEEEGGEGRWTWNQRVERFSAEAAGWLLSDVVSFAIYSPRASPLVKVNNYADASAGRALLFAFFIFFFFWEGGKNRGNFFLPFLLLQYFFFFFWR